MRAPSRRRERVAVRPRTLDRRVEHLFHAVSLDGFKLSDGETPTAWGHLLTTGHFVNAVYGEFDVTLADLDNMVHNFRNVTPKQRELPVDYSHTSRNPETIDQAKAAGWIKDVEVRARDDARGYGELWGKTEFTPACADAVRKKELKYYSAEFRPHFIHKNSGKDIGPTLVSAAVTIRPFVEGLHAISLSDTATAGDIPVSVGALRLGDALDMEDSLNDLLQDLSQQVYQRFGYGANVRDVFGAGDGQCVIIEMNGTMYRIDWADDENTDEPVLGNTLTPVKAQYADVTLTEDTMHKHTITLSDGTKLDVTEDQLKTLKPAAGAQGGTTSTAAASPDVVALTDSVKQLTGLVTTLVQRDTDREKASSEAAIRARLTQHVKDRKILQKQFDPMLALALADPAKFEALEKTFVPLFGAKEHGTGSDASREDRGARRGISGEVITATDDDITQTGAEAEFNERVDAHIKANPKATLKEAARAVALADPDLETRRRSEMENAVLPFSSRTVNRHAEIAS